MNKRLIPQLFLAGCLIGISVACVSHAQIYLPSADVSVEHPIDIDPDILRAVTDEAGGLAPRTSRNCASGSTPCHGILYSRFDARIDAPSGGSASPTFVFEHRIRVGQDATSSYPNYLQAVGEYIIYSPTVFGERQFEGMGDCTQDSAGFTALTSLVGGLVNTSRFIAAANFANISQSITGPTLSSYVIPYDSAGGGYVTVNTISCAIKDVSVPANVAFQAITIDQNQQVLAAGSFVNYAPVAENNLWYYPLDNRPAIVDLEVGGGGDNFYVDVTFSEGVELSGGNPVSSAQFEVHLVGRTTPLSSRTDEMISVDDATRPGGAPVQAGDTVVRLRLGNPTEAASRITDPNILVSVWPKSEIIAEDSKEAIHTGEEWWVRAWYDHRAPYIKTAVVGGGSEFVDITFNRGVKFEVSFNRNEADLTGTAPPTVDDFVIRFYDRSEGTVQDHLPARVTVMDAGGIQAAAGVTQLQLGMPAEVIRDYDPIDTIDIRTAQKQKDPTHPSLASVFVHSDDGVSSRKNSKFATEVGDTNYPRTAAFAQVGSLQLKGRQFSLVVDIGSQTNELAAGGAAKTFSASLESVEGSSFESGERAIVRLSGDGLIFPGGNLTFAALDTPQTFQVRAAQTARGMPGIMAALVNNLDKTAVVSSPVQTVSISRTFTLSFAGSALDLVIGRSAEVEVGLLGSETALLVGSETLTAEIGWMDGLPSNVTLPDGGTISLSATDRSARVTLTAANNASEVENASLEISSASVDPVSAGTVDSAATLPARVVRQIPVKVTFVDAGDPPSADARIGGETQLQMTLDGASALGSNRVSVMFAIDPQVPGVTLSPERATFDSSGSMQTITISVDPDVMTRLSGVSLRPTVTPAEQTRLGAITPVPVGFDEAGSLLSVKLVPSFAFAPAEGDMSENEVFAGLITSVAGSRPVLGGEYTIVPGTGVLTKLNLYAPVDVTGDVYVCVRQVQESAGKCMDAMDFSTMASTIDEVGAFTNEVHWAAVADGMFESLGMKRVYVAPPVGFRTDTIAYRSGGGNVDTGLSAAPAITGMFEVGIVEESTVTGAVLSASSPVVNLLGPDTRHLTPRSSKVLRITALEGVAFSAGEYNPGAANIRDLIGNNQLLSIGNPSVTLIPIEDPLDLDLSGISLFEPPMGVADSLTVDLPVRGDGTRIQEADMEVTITIHEFDSASLTFTTRSTILTARAQTGSASVMLDSATLGDLDLDMLPENSFVEVRAVATAEGEEVVGSFRFLVTSETAPTDNTPIPGPYAQAEIAAAGQTAGDLSLQNDLGIQDVPGVGPVSEVPTGVFDYLIANLDDAEVVTMVLELEEAAGTGLVQHKYTEEDGWSEFVVTDFDRVYSAPAPCPSPSASREVAGDDSTSGNAWRLAHNGVREGDGCILLQIREGGMNDADRAENGVLFDPTALAAGARRGGGGGAIDPVWLILLAVGALLSSAGSWRRRRFLA